MATGHYSEVTRLQHGVSVLWPSFIAASILIVIVFAAVDPLTVLPDRSRTATYTIAFFTFWVVIACACQGTLYFYRPVPGRVEIAKSGPGTEGK